MTAMSVASSELRSFSLKDAISKNTVVAGMRRTLFNDDTDRETASKQEHTVDTSAESGEDPSRHKFSLASKKIMHGIIEGQARVDEKSRRNLLDSDRPELRWRVHNLVHHRFFAVPVCLLVVANAIYIGIETDLRLSSDGTFDAWYVSELCFAFLFVVEVALRLYAERSKFFFDAWNVFDFVVVSSNVVDTLVLYHLANGNTLDLLVALRIVRLFRLVRIFRLLKFFKELWLLVSGIPGAARTLGWAWLLIVNIIYIFAIFCTRMLGKPHQDDAQMARYFGTVPRSMWTLFTVITAEGWVEVARDAQELEPWAAAFFAFFLSTTTFATMHVVVGVIVQNTIKNSTSRKNEMAKVKHAKDAVALSKILGVFQEADTNSDGEVTKAEFLAALSKKEVIRQLHEVNVDVRTAETLFDILDYDESGSLDAYEFIEGVMEARGEARAKDVLAVQCDLWKADKVITARADRFERKLGSSLRDVDAAVERFQQDVRWLVQSVSPVLLAEEEYSYGDGDGVPKLEEAMPVVEEMETKSRGTPGGCAGAGASLETGRFHSLGS